MLVSYLRYREYIYYYNARAREGLRLRFNLAAQETVTRRLNIRLPCGKRPCDCRREQNGNDDDDYNNALHFLLLSLDLLYSQVILFSMRTLVCGKGTSMELVLIEMPDAPLIHAVVTFSTIYINSCSVVLPTSDESLTLHQPLAVRLSS